LEEEYITITLPIYGKPKADRLLIKHTMEICTHFIFSTKNLLSFLVSVVAVSIFFTMAISVFWLSNLADISVLSDAFWQQWLAGNTYQIFFETLLWQSIPQIFAQPIDWSMWLYKPALIYALIAYYFLYKVCVITKLSIIKYLLIALTVIILPYFFGTALFLFMDIKMNESGPIVAFMWLNTLYLIIPFSYQLISKIKTSNSCFL